MTEKEWRIIFANNLIRAIAKYGCTYREFAEDVGIFETALNNYLHGRRSPSSYILKKMTAILRCSADDLIEEDW